jgi:hypothetical protein
VFSLAHYRIYSSHVQLRKVVSGGSTLQLRVANVSLETFSAAFFWIISTVLRMIFQLVSKSRALFSVEWQNKQFPRKKKRYPISVDPCPHHHYHYKENEQEIKEVKALIFMYIFAISKDTDCCVCVCVCVYVKSIALSLSLRFSSI